MEVVYFFYESGKVRVPLFDHDMNLTNALLSQGGIWNEPQNEFHFEKIPGIETIRRSLNQVPCVLVNETSPVPFRIFGFWRQPWKNFYNSRPAVRKEPVKTSQSAKQTRFSAEQFPFGFPGPEDNLTPPIQLPEKFPEKLERILDDELRSRKYSIRTIKAYIYYNRLICRILQKNPKEIKPEDITQFLAGMEKSNCSSSAMNLAISAIKFLYKEILKTKEINEQHRPKEDRRLPVVLSKAEITRILSMEKNPKHRLLLMLTYSSGLRVSEVVSLRKEHIDAARKVIYIKMGKGRKDRCTLLSETAARYLMEYCSIYTIKSWIFPGQPETTHLSIRSAQNIFNKAVSNAEIQKDISIHSLRHSFATHLLESGTDIRYIQSLLGHANVRTTERYTHIAQRNILRIKSTLDTMA